MGKDANSKSIAELKAQNDRLMAELVINRNLAKAQNARLDSLEQRMAVGDVQSALNDGIKGVNDAILNQCKDWLDHQHARWQRACADFTRALFLTDQNYNKVMSAVPKPSTLEAVLKAVITGLAVVQPEFALFAVIIDLGYPGKKEQYEKVVKAKELFKDAWEKGKEALEKSEQHERHETQLDAKLKFFQDKMEDCSEMSSWITELYAACRHVLSYTSGGNAAAATNGVRMTWRSVLGEAQPYHRGELTVLSLSLTYDLLRAFCEESVKLYADLGPIGKVRISQVKAIDVVSKGGGSEIDFLGLDSAKRKVLYDLFKDVDLGSKRPTVANYKDLILKWKFAN